MLQQYSEQWLLFTLIFTRISGMMVVAPVFATRSLPTHVRILFAMMLSIVVVPFASSDVPIVVSSLVELAVLASREAVLGIGIGLALRILFSGFVMSGAIVSRTSGLRLSDIAADEAQESVPVVSRFFELATLASFLLVGGHRQAITVLLDSFQWSVPGESFAWQSLLAALVDITAQSFIVAIRLAAPVVFALLLTIITIGLISRTLPQLNTLAVGFNVQSVVLLATLAFSLGSLSWILAEHSDQALATLRVAFEEGAGQAALIE